MPAPAAKAEQPKVPTAACLAPAFHTSHPGPAAFVDKRPVAVAQRRMQEMINQSARVQQATAMQEMINQSPRQQQAAALQTQIAQSPSQQQAAQRITAAPAPVQMKANKTGLPNELKAGVENLSGYSLDDVQVHYNSAKPAELQAHAYAQGTDIHLAPGQEQHLPHEAWHVVQQKQGRVQPTQQLKGVEVNDDSELEKEADAMGKRAQHLVTSGDVPLRNVAPGRLLVQRLVDWKPGRHQDGSLDGFVNAVSAIVEEGAAAALTGHDALTGTDGHTLRWKDTAILLMADRDQEDAGGEEVEATTKAAKQFASAHYGYAVEAYASAAIRARRITPSGYAVTLQGSRGMTRPDIIVADNHGTEVGWFDITSANSVDHIDKKVGSAWRTKPYVAEITYAPLVIADLATSGAGIGVRVAARGAVRRKNDSWKAFRNGKRTSFNTALKKLLSAPPQAPGAQVPGVRGRGVRGRGVRGRGARGRAPSSATFAAPTGSMQNKRAQTKQALETVFPLENMTPKLITGILVAFCLPIAKYGFNRGGSKATGETLLRGYQEKELE